MYGNYYPSKTLGPIVSLGYRPVSDDDAYEGGGSIVGPVVGTQYYVNNAGSDSNSGTSPGNPWRTINKVNNSIFFPGDTINFNGGQTFNDAVLFINQTNVPSKGDITGARPITVQSYGTGQAILSAGNHTFDAPYTLGIIALVDSVSGVVFNNITVNGFTGITSIINTKDFITGWSTGGTSTVLNNQVTAPDSTLTGASITDSAVNEAHYDVYNVNVVAGTTYTLTMSVKQGTGRYISIKPTVTTGGYPWVTIDTQLGTIQANAAISSSSIVSQGSGWYLVTLTWVNGFSNLDDVLIATSNVATPPLTSNFAGNAYAGTGTTVYVWNITVTYSSYSYTGITITNTLGTNNASSMQNVTVKNCTFIDICPTVNPAITELGAVFCAGFNNWTSTCGGLSNINVLNNTCYGLTNPGYGQFFSGTACNGDPINNLNMAGLLIQGNIIHDMCYGITIEGWGGPTQDPTKGSVLTKVQYNLVHDCGAAICTCGGSTGILAYQSFSLVFQFNEVYNQKSSCGTTGGACDNGAFDFDIGCTYCLGQYNYTHGCEGYSFTPNGGGPTTGTGFHTWRYNISENDNNAPISGANLQGVIAIYNPNQFPCWIYNNTIYQNVSSLGASSPPGLTWGFDAYGFPAGWIIANNIFYINGVSNTNIVFFVNGSVVTAGSLFMDYNIYYNSTGANPQWEYNTVNYTSLATWHTASGLDAHSQVINPGLTTPGGGGTLTWTPSSQNTWPPGGNPVAYKLSSIASPCIGTGVDLTQAPYLLNVGTRDFFGNPIPHGHGTGYNIGADGGYP